MHRAPVTPARPWPRAPTRAASCSACFLLRPCPRPSSASATAPRPSKMRSCGGPSSAVTSYATSSPRRASSSCSADLKSTGMLERLLDLRRERLDDRLRRRARSPNVQVAGADHRLDHRRQHALGAHERVGALAARPAAPPRAAARAAQALGDAPAGAARDRLRADLREPAGAEALGLQARVQVRRDRQREHAVAEERQPRVGVRAPLAPRRVREDLPREILRQLVEQLREGAASGPRSRSVGRACASDEVDGLADGEDLAGLLVGHPHAVGVLELLHERVEVERVGLEVLLEARRLADRVGLDVELVGEVLADQRSKTCSRVMAPATASRRRGRRRAAAQRRRAPPRAPSCVRPTMSSRAPRSATRSPARSRVRVKRPCGDDAGAAQPEQVGAARPARGRSRRAAPRARRAAAARRPCPRGLDVAASRIARIRSLRDALHQLQRDVAGEAVGHDDVGGARR